MFTKYSILPVAVAALALPVMAEDSMPTAVFGDWQSACDAWGVAATCSATWAPGLHVSHWVQSYQIVDAASGVQIFAGRGLYQMAQGKVDGIWEDSRGQILPLAGTYDGNGITVIWGDASREIGRSVYRLEDGTLQVADSVLTETGWRTFMQIDYALVGADE